MHIMFANGILDPTSRDHARNEINASATLFEEVLQTPKPMLFANAVAKSLRIGRVLLGVSSYDDSIQ
jgi:hypothetical protein